MANFTKLTIDNDLVINGDLNCNYLNSDNELNKSIDFFFSDVLEKEGFSSVSVYDALNDDTGARVFDYDRTYLIIIRLNSGTYLNFGIVNWKSYSAGMGYGGVTKSLKVSSNTYTIGYYYYNYCGRLKLTLNGSDTATTTGTVYYKKIGRDPNSLKIS